MSERPVAEVGRVYALVTLAAFVFTRLNGHSVLGPYVHLAVAFVFVWVALRMARGRLKHFGLYLGGVLSPDPDDPRPAGPLGLFDLGRALKNAVPPALRELAVAALVALVLFPPFAAGFAWWHGSVGAFELVLPSLDFVLAQMLLVALPEEAFFRGYVMTRLQDAERTRMNLFGASFGPLSMIAQAVLFAVIHFVVDPHPARLAVFFPALVFGWLRAKRQGIGAAVFFHAMCNVYSKILSESWL